jgi:hypothetical protein
MKIIVLFTLFFYSFTGVEGQVTKINYGNYEGKFDQCKFSVRIPFKVNQNNQIVIPVKIVDTIVNFLFDTGTSVSIIGESIYKRFSSRDLGFAYLADNNVENKYQKLIAIDKIQFDSLEITQLPFFVSKIDTVRYSGIIGANLINSLNWYLDYNSFLITITDGVLRKDSILSEINIGYENNLPFAVLKIGSENMGNCFFDTGFSRGLKVPSKIAKLVTNIGSDSIQVYKQISQIQTLFGGGVDTTTIISIKNHLSISKFLIPEVEIFASQNNNNENIFLGQEFLMNYNIGIYSKNMKYILYDRNILHKNSKNSFPFIFSWKNNHLVVALIFVCTDADAKGILIGDEVEAMDDILVSDFITKINFSSWISNKNIMSVKFKKLKEPMQIKRQKQRPAKDCGR